LEVQVVKAHWIVYIVGLHSSSSFIPFIHFCDTKYLDFRFEIRVLLIAKILSKFLITTKLLGEICE
jgi:hypothetical protein